jgi:hypothetical protein
MFESMGDVTVQALPRTTALIGMEREAVAQKAGQMREARPVENTEAGEKPKTETGQDQEGRTRNRLEGGKIIVETYDEYGKLLKRTPPGYLPFGETA